MRELIRDDILTNNTIQFDFNPLVDTDGKDLQSYISYNGVNFTNINKKRIYYSKNLLGESKWAVDLKGATLNNNNIFKKFGRNGKKCDAVIASASPTLKVPFEDMQEIERILISG